MGDPVRKTSNTNEARSGSFGSQGDPGEVSNDRCEAAGLPGLQYRSDYWVLSKSPTDHPVDWTDVQWDKALSYDRRQSRPQVVHVHLQGGG